MSDEIGECKTPKQPSDTRYVLSTDRADCLLRAIIEHAEKGELVLPIEKDWQGNIVFYLPDESGSYKEKGLHCVIRIEEIEMNKDGVKQRISRHDKDIVSLEGHEVLELADVGDYATGIFLPRKISEEESETI